MVSFDNLWAIKIPRWLREEAAAIGVKIRPGSLSGYSDKLKVIQVNSRDYRSTEELVVVILHELGHAHTTMKFFPESAHKRDLMHFAYACGVPDEEASRYVYASELAAWAWAEAKCPPELRDVFDRKRAAALSTYYYPLAGSDAFDWERAFRNLFRQLANLVEVREPDEPKGLVPVSQVSGESRK